MKLSSALDTERLSVAVHASGALLQADLFIPSTLRSLVIFAHGSGSGRHSPRNRLVAGELNEAGIATMLADLLTDSEVAAIDGPGIDIPLLASRLIALIDWAHKDPRFHSLRIGCFGSSTGAAAALEAAAARPAIIRAVVSRGGRTDLAINSLAFVVAPTLLIVGSADPLVLQLNQQALAMLPDSTVKALKIINGASHLFEEPGTLQKAAEAARAWFLSNLNHKES